ncbi:oxidoreductase,aldo/keto reductase family [Legionella quinlivanii]|uniref:Oxidoreductase,aldo/keto reductase family n=1 Tax=Legionella quinlivanii TaxID=45073 RepID=A0A0W0Y6L0_9GAMM|nr:aldo/keto reductase [Legionella quinlivanii]KTD52292.1 oxidoreductase,aldo/keto reductase family [Legionella quinlivanii]SEF73376.1 Aldo/keto reductase [Legionella quinlivanii DSM 21216]STY12208.1 oxidoreductase,aldo/keto reductase family [Legionella quinlivanii]
MNQDKLLPSILYGTAWKEEQTEVLCYQALKAGFTGIDTANQRRHYYEEGVGLGISQFLIESGQSRESLFLQSKYTYAEGQDHRKPYDESDSYANQVRQSLESSLSHLKTDYLDSYILHGPYSGQGLTEQDWEVWTTMEELAREGKVRMLGISNVNFAQFKALYQRAAIKPRFVQNRCFAVKLWDREIRQFCDEKSCVYQGFSLLTANYQYLANPKLHLLCKKYNTTLAQMIFRFALDIGILALTGTTSLQHMKEDLDIGNFLLMPSEIAQIEEIAF